MTIFPRVLIVSAAPLTASGGTGVTLRNLFAAWPLDRLAVLHVDPGTGESTVAHKRLRAGLTLGGMRVPDWLVDVLRKPLRRQAASVGSASANSNVRSSRSRGADLRVLTDAAGGALTHETRAFVRDAAPDIVYSPLGSLTMMRMACAAAEAAGCPLVPHLMDDWPSTRFAAGELGGLGRRWVQRSVARLLGAAPFSFVISEPMAREYGRRYGGRYVVSLNPADDEAFDLPLVGQGKPSRLVYAGGLHLGRAEQLASLAAVLPVGAVLTVHSFHDWPEGIPTPAALRLAGALAAEEVTASLAEHDLVVHVESSEPRYREYTRLSVSTKLPTALASGRPVLALTPPGLASAEFVVERGGIVIERADELPAALDALAADAPERALASRTAVADLRGDRVRDAFRAALAELVTLKSSTPDSKDLPT